MAEEATNLQKDAGRRLTRLADGTVVAVEVRGAATAPELAEDALRAATRAVVDGLGAPPPVKRDNPGGIVGRSAAMRELFRLLDRIRGSNATVLITGENGTGKELVARTIHEHSSRAKRRFVATNCSAFNDNLLESELFGHKRGSFTGAVSDKPGLFEVADGGTFLLDEVGDMSPALQVKLLRVLQEGVFMPVGATEQRKVDVRIIAATNRDIARMVAEGTFREDLYYRLHVVHLKVPPLRDRRDDIPPLIDHFLAELKARDGRRKALSDAVMGRLLAHDWPGNVRELENEIERLWVLSGEDAVIGEEYLTPGVGRRRETPAGAPPAPDPNASVEVADRSLPEAVEMLERQMIADRLHKAKGNKTRAADMLGISRRNLIRKVQAYGLEDSRRGSDPH